MDADSQNIYIIKGDNSSVFAKYIQSCFKVTSIFSKIQKLLATYNQHYYYHKCHTRCCVIDQRVLEEKANSLN